MNIFPVLVRSIGQRIAFGTVDKLRILIVFQKTPRRGTAIAFG
jgi:hypothetical protein